MGDVAISDPVAALAAQVNRFGTSAPEGYRFVTIPVAAPMNPGLALTALTIYQRRATDAYNQFHDAGSEMAINAANAGFSDPVSFVTARLPEVLATIGGFADALGLPSNPTPGTGPEIGSPGGAVLLAAGFLGFWWLMDNKR
jgi:hypothetical protein